MEFRQVISVEEAKAMVRKHWFNKDIEEVCLIDAAGRTLAERLFAAEDVPGFDRSSMDGFAVRAADTFMSSETSPSCLEICGEVLVGKEAPGKLVPGKAVKISTGAMLPPAADAVVKVEQTEVVEDRRVYIYKPVAPFENVIRRGEDISKGEEILPRGHLLRPQDIGFLASQGILRVPVFALPRVGVVTTGNEVVPPEEKPLPGQVRDINSYTLFTLIKNNGGLPELYGIVPDDRVLLRKAVLDLLETSDLVLLSGGSSVGMQDLTVNVLEEVGGSGAILFHGISVSPGKPTVCSLIKDKLVIGLPGHPVSAITVFNILVSPLLRTPKIKERSVKAFLSENSPASFGRDTYVRVRVYQKNDCLWAEPVKGKSGTISTLVRADGEFIIPAGKEGFPAGTPVEVQLF